MTIPISSIVIADRIRKSDYGDLQALADRIAAVGLIQPIVLQRTDTGYLLVAGERRLKALTLLGYTEVHHGLTSVVGKPGFVFRDEVAAPSVLREIELSENLERVDFNWRDKIKAFCELHRLWSYADPTWTQERTATRLGYSRTYITHCLLIEKHLDSESYAQCESLSDAMQVYGRSLADKAVAELSRRTIPQAPPAPDPVLDALGGDLPPVDIATPASTFIKLSSMLHNVDCVRYLLDMPPESVDHCITDWPYAIDVDYMQQASDGLTNHDRIRETHNVDSNLALHSTVIPLIHRVLRPGGYFITWLDIMTWQRTYDLLCAAGFTVQRWPYVWHKTHACRNTMATVNFTKNLEIAIVAHKGVGILATTNVPSVVSASRSEYASNPFAKPEAVWTPLIEAVSLQGQTILDPFAGEGSCPLAVVGGGPPVLLIKISIAPSWLSTA